MSKLKNEYDNDEAWLRAAADAMRPDFEAMNKPLPAVMRFDFGFTGHYFYAPTGSYLTRFREYDPQIGRWLSRDPLFKAEQREGPNLYAYVHNSPINHVDIYGMKKSPEECACAKAPTMELPYIHPYIKEARAVICYDGKPIRCRGHTRR